MKKFSIYIATFTALILFPNLIGAQTLTWDETKADSIEYNDYNAYTPQVVISGDTVVAVWMQDGGSGTNHIYSNYSTDGGATWSDTQRIDNVAWGASNPQIAISGDAGGDTVVAVWCQDDGSYYSIYSNYSTDGGVTWHSAQLIENYNGYQQSEPQVAISGSNVAAVWAQYDGVGAGYGTKHVYSNYAVFSGGILTWTPGNTQLIEYSGGHSGDVPQVVISGDTVVAVWQQLDGSFSPHIYSNYATISAGAAVWDATTVDTVSNPHNDSDGVYNPQIAIAGDADGDTVVVVWQQYAGGYHIYSNYAAIDGTGAVIWDETKANTTEDSSGRAINPQIAASGNTVVAVWVQNDGDYDRICSNYSTDDGATWSDTQLINNVTDYDAEAPQIAISGDNVVAVWVQNDGNIYDRIYSNYTTIDDVGAVVWDTTNVDTVSNGDGGGDHPQIAISGDNVVAVWEQTGNAGGGYPISIYSNYAQVVADSDNMTGDFGSLPVGPLAVGISAFLVWWKRRKQE